ncbi:GntR family transcriptional regulator [Pseudochelatococcus sp. B33]
MAEVASKLRGETAYTRLKNEIANGEMAPGSRVREVEIAERLKISRTPVREALRRLEADGLITHVPHLGAVVAKLDHQAVIELYGMREVLESTAARYAARHASEAEVQDLADIVATEMDHADNPSALAQINRTFHAGLYHAAHNRFLLKALGSLSDAMILLGGTTLFVDSRSVTAHEEHLAIVGAIAARDADAAEEAARLHIRNAQRARLKLLRAEMMDGNGPNAVEADAAGSGDQKSRQGSAA